MRPRWLRTPIPDGTGRWDSPEWRLARIQRAAQSLGWRVQQAPGTRGLRPHRATYRVRELVPGRVLFERWPGRYGLDLADLEEIVAEHGADLGSRDTGRRWTARR